MTSTRSCTVTATLRGMPMVMSLFWTTEDPLALTLVFCNDEEWVLSRDAVTRAITGGAIPIDDIVAAEITVICTGKTVSVERFYKNLQPIPVVLPKDDLREFLDSTYQVIPPGKEYTVIDWRAEFPEFA